jgi:hypothetical protein
VSGRRDACRARAVRRPDLDETPVAVLDHRHPVIDVAQHPALDGRRLGLAQIPAAQAPAAHAPMAAAVKPVAAVEPALTGSLPAPRRA